MNNYTLSSSSIAASRKPQRRNLCKQYADRVELLARLASAVGWAQNAFSYEIFWSVCLSFETDKPTLGNQQAATKCRLIIYVESEMR